MIDVVGVYINITTKPSETLLEHCLNPIQHQRLTHRIIHDDTEMKPVRSRPDTVGYAWLGNLEAVVEM